MTPSHLLCPAEDRCSLNKLPTGTATDGERPVTGDLYASLTGRSTASAVSQTPEASSERQTRSVL
jgi:hypothetical protein